MPPPGPFSFTYPDGVDDDQEDGEGDRPEIKGLRVEINYVKLENNSKSMLN